jgi:hypothetical protein
MGTGHGAQHEYSMSTKDRSRDIQIIGVRKVHVTRYQVSILSEQKFFVSVHHVINYMRYYVGRKLKVYPSDEDHNISSDYENATLTVRGQKPLVQYH